jgi:hypothetical protein
MVKATEGEYVYWKPSADPPGRPPLLCCVQYAGTLTCRVTVLADGRRLIPAKPKGKPRYAGWNQVERIGPEPPEWYSRLSLYQKAIRRL